MIEINEQCRKCIHFQVCSSALKEELYLREILLEEENPKCKMFVEVMHGRWEDDYGDYVCSCCRTVFTDELVWLVPGESNKPNYCPNCGAKMDGDKHE